VQKQKERAAHAHAGHVPGVCRRGHGVYRIKDGESFVLQARSDWLAKLSERKYLLIIRKGVFNYGNGKGL
jgi:hypothetical protein